MQSIFWKHNNSKEAQTEPNEAVEENMVVEDPVTTGNKEPEEQEVIYVPAGAESSNYGTNSGSEDDDVQLFDLNWMWLWVIVCMKNTQQYT